MKVMRRFVEYIVGIRREFGDKDWFIVSGGFFRYDGNIDQRYYPGDYSDVERVTDEDDDIRSR